MRTWHGYVVEWATTDIRYKAVVVELGIVCTRTDASGGITTATTVGSGVVHGGCARAAAAGGRREAACAEGVEKVERERIFLRCEIEDPQDVDHSKDEPAGGECIERGKVRKYGLIDADDGKDNGNGTKGHDLETMHRYGVGCKGVDDADDEEKL